MTTAADRHPTTSERAHETLLRAFLLLLILAPLPLGGYRPLPWSVNAIAAALLLIAWGSITLRSGAGPAAGPARLAVPMLLGGVLAAWMAVQTLIPPLPQWSNPIWTEAAALLPLDAASAPIGLHPERAKETLLRFLTHCAIFFLAVQLGRARHNAERIFTTLAYMGGGYALYGLVMHLGGFDLILWWERWSYNDSVTSTFVNRNHFATFAGITLLCGFGLLWRAVSRWGDPSDAKKLLQLGADLLERRWLLLLGACLTFSALVLTNSRAGLAATLAALLLLMLLLTRSMPASRRSPLIPYLLLGMGGFLLLMLLLGGHTASRLGELTLAAASRDDLFRLTLRAIADAPWLGHGAGSFGDVIRIYRDASLPDGVTWSHAHNSYLEFALELGIPALLVLLTLYAWILGSCIVGLVRRRRDRTYPAVGIAATLLVALHSLVDFSVQIPGVAIPYAVVLGVAYAQSWSSRNVDQ